MIKFDSTKIPEYALKVARILLKEGYDCYLVGGAVRDNLLGIYTHNYDFTTNATPDELIKIESFPKAVQINQRFGTIAVIVADEHGENFNVDVTTYRSESEYVGGRWPSEVKLGVSLGEDLKRRDFTINALTINMKDVIEGKEVKIIDNFKGIKDLEDKIIRTVGDPMERFSEDGLRAVRACRIASNKEFTIEPKTYDAIKQTLHITKKISIERFRDEFDKILLKSVKPSVGLNLLKDTGILEIFIPELLEGLNVNQPKFHVHDVFEHALACVDKAEDKVKLAALFHDIAKPRCADGEGHFYGHDQMGAIMVREILTRLKYPKEQVEKTAKLIENHMFFYPYSIYDDPNFNSEELKMKDRDEKLNIGWKDNAIRRFIQRVGEENIEDLFRLRIADATCNPKSSWDPTEIDRLQARISKVLSEDNALKISDLDIDGNDLKEMGYNGKEIGDILQKLLDKVIDDPVLNEKSRLKEIVKEKTVK